VLYQLSYVGQKQKKNLSMAWDRLAGTIGNSNEQNSEKMERETGIEPATLSLEG
jgi:sterol desaturase/sphingolipid hydroxylase (fatty acid hydroxylase superfamily)